MNKRHIAALRAKTQSEAQARQIIVGTITGFKISQRKINRARRAVFELAFRRSEDGKVFNLLVPYGLKERCMSELSGESALEALSVEVAPMSPDGGYRRKDNEYELINFELRTAQG